MKSRLHIQGKQTVVRKSRLCIQGKQINVLSTSQTPVSPGQDELSPLLQLVKKTEEEKHVSLSEETKQLPKKGGKKKRTTEEYVTLAKQVHGDLYDYSGTVYTGSKDPITYYCKTCKDDYTQEANSHLRGTKCGRCSKREAGLKRRLTQEEFLERAKLVHEDTYDYRYAKYITYDDPVIIFCKACRVTFEQTPDSHLHGSGCNTCGHIRGGLKKRLTNQQFIAAARAVHEPGHYDYRKTVYFSRNEYVDIYCNVCKESFRQPAGSHLSGRGCMKCGRDRTIMALRKSLSIFIEQSKEVFGNRYGYGKTVYVNSGTRVELTCNTCNGDFKQFPANHLRGHDGCNTCKRVRVESKGATAIREYLTERKIPFECEVELPDILPMKRYDFRFFYNKRWYFVEYDGSQHFRFSPGWHDTFEYFLERQEVDKLKNHIAILCGYTMVRLSDESKVIENLDKILSSSEGVFHVDNPDLYAHMYTDLDINVVNEHCAAYFGLRKSVEC